ncbi:MAG: hypothetical protein HYZ84_06750 [Candidatus Omnitrophica bacterium]|nr:hypothetical protein [Candidatus Omnitrophota bacterium]
MMKTITKVFLLAAAIGFSAGNTAMAQADAQPEFSAQMVSTIGGQKMAGKFFSSNGKIRLEMGENIIINRFDQNLSWVLIPSQHRYMENAIDSGMALRMMQEIPGETERVTMGSESVDGKRAEKFKVTYTPPDGKPESLYQWIAPDNPVPVKVAALDDSWSVEYQNIQSGPQPPDLFEIPAGYQKFQVSAIPGASNSGSLFDSEQ